MGPREDAQPQGVKCPALVTQPSRGRAIQEVSHAHVCARTPPLSITLRACERLSQRLLYQPPRKRGPCGSSLLPFPGDHTDPPCSAEPLGQLCGWRDRRGKHLANQGGLGHS